MWLPACARLEHRVDAAEARGIGDEAQRRLDTVRCDQVRDVEREQAAEAGIADDRDLRVLLEAAGEVGRSVRLATDAGLERLQPAQEQITGIRRRDNPGVPAELVKARGIRLALTDDCAEQDVVVAAEVLRRTVQD